MAGVVALKHYRRPEVEVVGDDVTIVCEFYMLKPLASNRTTPAFARIEGARPVDAAPYAIPAHVRVLFARNDPAISRHRRLRYRVSPTGSKSSGVAACGGYPDARVERTARIVRGTKGRWRPFAARGHYAGD